MSCSSPPPRPPGCQAELILTTVYAAGLRTSLLCDVAELRKVDSGVPERVLAVIANGAPSGQTALLRLLLDPEFFTQHHPTFTDEGFGIDLSFDTLYRCTLPWASIKMVLIEPAPPEPEAPGTEVAPTSKVGHLRLVD